MHDIWVLALVAAFGQDHVGVVDEPLVYYRQHGDNEMGAVAAESKVQKVMRNIKPVCSGEFAERKRAYIRQTRDLANQLSLVNDVLEDVRCFLREFADIGNRSKLARVRFYWRHNISKNHGTLWMYLWV